MRTYEPLEDEKIETTAKNMVNLALQRGDLVRANFEGKQLLALGSTDPQSIIRQVRTDMEEEG